MTIWYILIAVAVVIGVIAIIASTKPNDWTIQREATMPGPPEKIFTYMDDLHKFNEWSPWAKLDPNMKLTYGGPASGAGANFTWEGNSKIGAGKMIVTESHPNDRVCCQFDFYKPMKCTNTAEFAFRPQGSETHVTWIVKGTAPFIFKLMLVFASADKMMGNNLEQGLANLKAIVAS